MQYIMTRGKLFQKQSYKKSSFNVRDENENME